MGIGNAAGGSRRPARSAPAHYPSWGLGTESIAEINPAAVTSLPLMGIGNQLPPVRDEPVFHHSLPLMGIGNHRRPTRRPSWRSPHYPSWGLGTHQRRPNAAQHLLLITPHGDWEHPPPPGQMIGTSNSLPLMGIGNRRTLPAPRRPAPAHYPSWGLGTPTRRAPTAPSRPHYPSWGLGTTCPPVAQQPRPPLITPHGDWEHSFSRRARVRPSAAHYPSWGLGTPAPSPRSPTGGHPHYPSWGLGTRSTRTSTSSPSGSLPLMGIGNEIVSGADAQPYVSLPLMGIGNSGLAGQTPQHPRSHYPSWGLGTRWT